MSPRRSRLLAAAMLLVLCCWWMASGSDSSSSTAAPLPRSQPDSVSDANSPARPTSSPSDPTEPLESQSDPNPDPCSLEALKADRLAMDAADDCQIDFADRGVCLAPVPFEHQNQPASQTANLLDWLAPCGLEDSQVVVECSENPCVALVDRSAILEGAGGCEPLELLATRLPSIDEELPPEGLWSSWTPVMLDVPSNPADAVRAGWRLEARRSDLASALSGQPRDEQARCERVRQVMSELDSPDPCNAIRSLWKCPVSEVELPPGTAEAYVSDAERRVADLLDTCPAFAESKHVFDCSGVPCILLIDLLPGQEPDDVFCGRPFGSVVLNPRRPDLVSVWMYQGIDQPVFDRFAEEQGIRVEIARAELEGQRDP